MNELRLRLSGHVEGHFAASGSHLSSGYFGSVQTKAIML